MKKEIKKIAMYLFNKENPQGKMFSFFGGKNSDEYKELLDDGWIDTPARLNLPKEMDTGLTEEMVVNADPQRLIAIIKDYGFIVITPEQLKAEAVKMADIGIDIENFSDEDIITEAERRGLKKSVEVDETEETNHDKLIDSGSNENIDNRKQSKLDEFNQRKEDFSNDELILIGKENGLSIKSNWKRETMIDKITEKLNEV